MTPKELSNELKRLHSGALVLARGYPGNGEPSDLEITVRCIEDGIFFVDQWIGAYEEGTNDTED